MVLLADGKRRLGKAAGEDDTVMSFAVRAVTRLAAVITATGVIGAVGLIVAPQSDSSGTYQVTSQIALNVRSGPSLKHGVLGVVGRGVYVRATGPAKNGWVPVTFNGRPGWVFAKYVAAVGQPAGGSTTTPVGSAKTTEYLNARSGAGLNYRVITLLSKGATVQLTGRASGPWRQIKEGGSLLWVHSSYLTGSAGLTPTPTPSRPGSPAQFFGVARVALDLRSSATDPHKVLREVAKNTKLGLTGTVRNGRAEVIYRGKTYWVTARYVTTTNPTSPKLPKATGTRYATAALDIRSSATNSFTLLEVPAGTALQITGVVANGRAQVIYQNAVRWVTAKYLAMTPPSSGKDYSKGLDGLRPASKAIVAEARQRFPQITTYYGVRPDPLPDHPSGRAVDMMIPNYRSASGKALGQSVANWLKDNAARLDVEYVIWDQRIWSVARAREGWRFMANRGSDTANHKDHIHVTVRDRRTSASAGNGAGSTSGVPASGTCKASYYDEPQPTASGERFDPMAMTAAHKTLPMNTKVRVTNLKNGQQVTVRINDRGPYISGRCLDLSKGAMAKIGGLSSGVISVRYEVL